MLLQQLPLPPSETIPVGFWAPCAGKREANQKQWDATSGIMATTTPAPKSLSHGQAIRMGGIGGQEAPVYACKKLETAVMSSLPQIISQEDQTFRAYGHGPG